MTITKKHVVILTITCLFVIIVSVAWLSLTRRVNGDSHGTVLEFYSDEGLTCAIGTLENPLVFHDFDLGWNNKTIYVRNVGDNAVIIMAIATGVPKDWVIIWEYDDSPINPETARKVTSSIYATYRVPVRGIALGITLRYRELSDKVI